MRRAWFYGSASRKLSMNATIRLARAEDASSFPEIERSAASSFRSIADLMWIADGQPTPALDYLPLIARGTVWVAEAMDHGLRGFLAAEQAGTELHIREVSVRSEHRAQGIGRRLIEAARSYAQAAGLSGLTLTTFRDVRWNAPFYAGLGFEILPTSSIGPRLGAILGQEAERGLPHERRCAMRCSLEALAYGNVASPPGQAPNSMFLLRVRSAAGPFGSRG